MPLSCYCHATTIAVRLLLPYVVAILWPCYCHDRLLPCALPCDGHVIATIWPSRACYCRVLAMRLPCFIAPLVLLPCYRYSHDEIPMLSPRYLSYSHAISMLSPSHRRVPAVLAAPPHCHIIAMSLPRRRPASSTKKARELYDETTLVELSRHLQSAPCDVCEPYDVCNTHYVM